MTPLSFRHEAIAFCGEFVGTTLFIFGALGSAKTTLAARTPDDLAVAGTALDSQTIVFIALGFGLALLTTAWTFYRVSGSLFNPAICLCLLLVGAVSPFRAAHLCIAQVSGAIAGAGLVAALMPGDVSMVITRLHPNINIAQGIWLEAFATAVLCICVTMLAAEKHKATFLAPVAIGLTLFSLHLVTALWTGAGLNPARALAPSVISAQFPREHYVYWVGPIIGACMAAGAYTLLKAFDYSTVVAGQDSDDAGLSPHALWRGQLGFSRQQRDALAAIGVPTQTVAAAEAAVVAEAQATAINMSRAPTAAIKQAEGAIAAPTAAALTIPTLDLSIATEGVTSADPLSMQSSAQQSGGIGAPGTHTSAIGAIMERSSTAVSAVTAVTSHA